MSAVEERQAEKRPLDKGDENEEEVVAAKEARVENGKAEEEVKEKTVKGKAYVIVNTAAITNGRNPFFAVPYVAGENEDEEDDDDVDEEDVNDEESSEGEGGSDGGEGEEEADSGDDEDGDDAEGGDESD
ncbi:unnamed protein product [Caenorhabditis bovis]|uniref:Uncharacterized protein n=1 Tax=Caenorhabditis bovis TaxID=2654633 RepID=A0A8S1EVU4_9PELO|nr:unnamed protein product [Caenorhabditis bovis]